MLGGANPAALAQARQSLGPPNTGGAHLTVPMNVSDVASWDTYFAPDDDIHAIILAELTAAVQAGGVECHSSQYGFTDQDIADAFSQLGKNPASRYLFDKTQEAGHSEQPIVQKLVNSLSADQWAIGTSSKAHQILHTKAVTLLYPSGRGWCVTGSFNLSASAQNQFNIVDVVVSLSRAKLFASKIDAMFDWVKANEGTNQP
jgi:hypothetical protein